MYSQSNNNNNSNCTIGEVAKKAKVSPMSVTRTYSSPDKVSERIKKKVIAAAKELGYQPNILARSLRSGKSMTVGITWSFGGPHNSSQAVREIAKILFDHGYVSYISDSYSDNKIIKDTLRNFISRKIDGLIIHADILDITADSELVEILHSIPNLVIVGKHFFNSPFDEIARSLQPPIDQIVSYWAKKGRKNIYYMVRDVREKRIRYFQNALKNNGLNYNDKIINTSYYGSNDIGACFQSALKEHFSDNFSADAILCACDEGAAGIITYLHQLGIKVPHDVAVCGWNNSQMSAYCNPPIASVERKSLETARVAAEMLLARLKGDKSAKKQINIKMEFVKRESAG